MLICTVGRTAGREGKSQADPQSDILTFFVESSIFVDKCQPVGYDLRMAFGFAPSTKGAAFKLRSCLIE
jgi:hypothetical protein